MQCKGPRISVKVVKHNLSIIKGGNEVKIAIIVLMTCQNINNGIQIKLAFCAPIARKRSFVP